MNTTQFYSNKVVLVTGATGLVGGWLTKALLAQGAKVIALIRDYERSAGSMLFQEGLLSRVTPVKGTPEDFRLMCRVLNEHQVETVFHLGAQTQVGIAKRDPMGTLEANVRGTWNLLEACRRNPVAAIVVASSANAYGHNMNLPYEETHHLLGKFPYDCSKSCQDMVSSMYAFSYGLPVAIARCSNIFGGGDQNPCRLIPDVIRTTWRGESYSIRSDGQFIRDYLYVLDAVDAYLTAAERLSGNAALAGEAFNFSLEVRVSVLDMVRMILVIMEQQRLEPVIQNRASGEIREQYMDCGKARRLLDWKPRYTLEEGLRETVAWYVDALEREDWGNRATMQATAQG